MSFKVRVVGYDLNELVMLETMKEAITTSELYGRIRFTYRGILEIGMIKLAVSVVQPFFHNYKI